MSTYGVPLLGLNYHLGFLTAMAKEQEKEKFSDINDVVSTYLDITASESLGDSILPAPPSLTHKEEWKLWLKLDLRLLPIIGLMFLMSYMDKCMVF